MPYSRPAVDAPSIVDAAGEPIAFGERWGMEGPPEDTYSVDAHPQRFAPLHVVADALVAWLRSTYDVVVVDALEDASTLIRHSAPVMDRAVRLVPAATDAAPLLVAWTSYPGVLVHAGAAFVGVLPICGCEACDETWDRAADDLERVVMAVTDGRLQESLDRGYAHTIEASDDGTASSGWSSDDGLDVTRRRAGRARLAARTGDRWLPWSPREQAG